MNILAQRVCWCKEYCEHIPAKLHALFFFGFFTLAHERIASIRGNARCLIRNPDTAKSKAYRLLTNARLRYALPRLLPYTRLVDEHSVIAVDFSTFGIWQILTFALQTRKGRAIPVYFNITRYPIKKDSQNRFVVETVESFVTLVGCRPLFVMDRGFACPSVIKHMAQQGHPFVVRVKGCKRFLNARGQLFAVRTTRIKDRNVRGYEEIPLRLVVSDTPDNGNEPWYLVTNDMRLARREIITRYYYRFEIEEFFKDAKWLQGLEQARFNRRESIETVLWFVCVGWWCMQRISETLSPPFRHHKSLVSFLRYFFEQITLEKILLAFSAIGPPPDVFLVSPFTRITPVRG